MIDLEEFDIVDDIIDDVIYYTEYARIEKRISNRQNDGFNDAMEECISELEECKTISDLHNLANNISKYANKAWEIASDNTDEDWENLMKTDYDTRYVEGKYSFYNTLNRVMKEYRI